MGVRAFFGDDTDEFLRDYWPSRPFVVHRDPARLAGLVDLPELSSLEARLALARATLGAATATDGVRSDELIASSEASDRHAAGSTLVFTGLKSRGLSRWTRALERDCHLPPESVLVNAHDCRAGAAKIPVHCDGGAFFAVQIHGRKRWRLAPNGKFLPERQMMLCEDIHEWQVVDMQPGSVIFVPRGYWHGTEVVGEDSLHLSIMTRQPTWADLLYFALRITRTLDTAPWLEAAPVMFEDGAFRTEAIAELAARMPELLRTIEIAARTADARDIERACASLGFR